LPIANSVSLLLPMQGQKIGSRMEVLASAAGNISRVDFTIDGKLIKRLNKSPYNFTWSASRLSDGPHKFRLEGYGRSSRMLTMLEIDIIKESQTQPALKLDEDEAVFMNELLTSPEEEEDAPQ